MAIFNRYVSLPEGRIFHTFLYMLVFFGVPCGCFTNIFTVPARESPSQTAAQDTWTERSPRLRRCRARRARVECPNPPVEKPIPQNVYRLMHVDICWCYPPANSHRTSDNLWLILSYFQGLCQFLAVLGLQTNIAFTFLWSKHGYSHN